MRKLIVLGVCFIIASCATAPAPKNPISIGQLENIEASYGIALSAAYAYSNIRLCRKSETISITNICARRSVIVAMQEANRKVKATLIDARTFIKNYPTLDASAYLFAANSALAVFQQIQTANGVK